MMSARRFIIASLGLTASALATIAFFNYSVDISGVYHTEDAAEKGRAISTVNKLLRSPHGVVQPHRDDRVLKWELARQSEAECFVTGSSRAMLFGREKLAFLGGECNSVANLAVSGAGFEDFVTAAGLIANKPSLKAVYVGIDPWAIRFGSDARYTQFESAYRDGRRLLGLTTKEQHAHWNKLANLVNGQYLRRNLEVLREGYAAESIKEVHPGWTNVTDIENVLQPDGSLIYSRHYAAAPPPPDGQVGNGSTKIQPPYVDAHVAAEFQQVLDVLHSRGAQVVLLLAPYHPKVMRCDSQKACAALKAVEEWAHALAERNGYQLIGSFDARQYGIGAELFHDELHMDVKAIGHLARPDVSPPP